MNDSLTDGRIDGHPKQRVFQSYYGIPLYREDGHIIGTVCHFDDAPIRVTNDVASTLDELGPVIAEAAFKSELVQNLSDNGKMDAVLLIQMACGESHNAVSVGSIYGMAKCFGPKNCHVSLDGHTLNVLMCDPNGEAACGKELFKEFEYVLTTPGLMGVKLE